MVFILALLALKKDMNFNMKHVRKATLLQSDHIVQY